MTAPVPRRTSPPIRLGEAAARFEQLLDQRPDLCAVQRTALVRVHLIEVLFDERHPSVSFRTHLCLPKQAALGLVPPPVELGKVDLAAAVAIHLRHSGVELRLAQLHSEQLLAQDPYLASV